MGDQAERITSVAKVVTLEMTEYQEGKYVCKIVQAGALDSNDITTTRDRLVAEMSNLPQSCDVIICVDHFNLTEIPMPLRQMMSIMFKVLVDRRFKGVVYATQHAMAIGGLSGETLANVIAGVARLRVRIARTPDQVDTAINELFATK
jgi:hypothetical protein